MREIEQRKSLGFGHPRGQGSSWRESNPPPNTWLLSCGTITSLNEISLFLPPLEVGIASVSFTGEETEFQSRALLKVTQQVLSDGAWII